MGNVYYIANSNDFWINNLNEFKEGLKGFSGGEFNSEVQYSYSDYKRKSKKALVNMSSDDFGVYLSRETGEELFLLEYIQKFIVEGETCIIHEVSYEHGSDMCITMYIITSENIKEKCLLDN